MLPFLRQTLPALRTAIQNGELVIEGVGTADEYEAEMAANKNSAAFNEPSVIYFIWEYLKTHERIVDSLVLIFFMLKILIKCIFFSEIFYAC